MLGGTKSKNGDPKGAEGATVISKDALKNIREQTEKGQKSDAIVITKEELDRMRAATVHISKDQVRE